MKAPAVFSPLIGRWLQVSALLQLMQYLVLSVVAVSMLVPFLWMFLTSLKPQADMFQIPPAIFTLRYTGENFVRAWTRGQFDRFLLNSMVVSGSVTVLNLFVTSLAGYAFARLQWRSRDVFFMLVLSVMMLPGLIALIPTFLIVRGIPLAGGNNWLGQHGTGWLDSFEGLIFPLAGSGFYVFLLRQFFLTLPKELEDAARIDGSREFGVFWRIMLPLCKPVLAVVALFSFQNAWNDFLWPLVIIQSDRMRTVQLGLALFRTQTNINWGALMAGTTIATLPSVILFLSFQQYFVRGLALTGIKG